MKRGRKKLPTREEEGIAINEKIRSRRVLVIDEEGNKLGEFHTPDAIALAQERSLDLVEVAPNAVPPVCRIGDWGRMKYERSKRAAEAKRKQHQMQIKELKIRPKTDEHDMDVKVRSAVKFLQEGNKVKVVVWFRGREHAHHEIGAEQCQRFAEACASAGTVESPPKMDGRRMFMILAPTAVRVDQPA